MKKLFYGLGAVAAVVTPVVAVVSCGSSSEDAKANLHFQNQGNVAVFSMTGSAFNAVLNAGGLSASDFDETGALTAEAKKDVAKVAVVEAVAADADSIQALVHAATNATISIGVFPHGEIEFIVTGKAEADLKAAAFKTALDATTITVAKTNTHFAGLADDAAKEAAAAKVNALWAEMKTLVKAAL